jgi:hypothetical protein
MKKSGSTIDVTAQSGGEYLVSVSDARGRTEHRVTVGAAELERYASGADPERLLRASFEFLLEREPKESILGSFPISTIERYFPEYPGEIRRRLG